MTLIHMTRALCRRYFQGFENDPAVYLNPADYQPYHYNEASADAYWQRQRELGRVHLAVMHEDAPVGEIILKKIDWTNGVCTLSIHLQNDRMKNRGIGTRAEILALEYAFEAMDMKTVLADSLRSNWRSRRVMEKAGFREIGCDDDYIYYRYERSRWKKIETDQKTT